MPVRCVHADTHGPMTAGDDSHDRPLPRGKSNHSRMDAARHQNPMKIQTLKFGAVLAALCVAPSTVFAQCTAEGPARATASADATRAVRGPPSAEDRLICLPEIGEDVAPRFRARRTAPQAVDLEEMTKVRRVVIDTPVLNSR